MEASEHARWERLRQDIAELEDRWIKAVRERNEKVLKHLLSDRVTAVFLDGSDAQGKEAVLNSLMKLSASLHGFEITRTNIRMLSPEAVLVHGHALLERRTNDEEPTSEPIHFTRVWNHRDGRWKLFAIHTSRKAT